MRGTLRCPHGHEIQGTLETVQGCALAWFYRDQDGKIAFEYEGETEIFWDTQMSLHRDSKPLFLCTAGDEWTEDECAFAAQQEDAPL
jgi:hypothetical protein